MRIRIRDLEFLIPWTRDGKIPIRDKQQNSLPPENEPFTHSRASEISTNADTETRFLIDVNSTAGPDQGLLKGQKLVENKLFIFW